MSIIIFTILIFVIAKSISNNDKFSKKMILLFIIIYVGILIYYWYKMETILGWKYGIAGADMQRHFDGAKLINDVNFSALNQFDIFESKISGLGYKIYVYFLYIQLYIPTFFSLYVNLFIVKVNQILLSLLSCVFISSYFSQTDMKDKKYKYLLIIILLLNISLPFTSIRLLRDTIIFFMLSLIFKVNTLKLSRKAKNIMLILIIIILFIFRSYTVIISVPLFFYFNNRKWMGVCISVLITLGIIFLPYWINLIPMQLFNGEFLSIIGFYKISFSSLIKILLSPSYFSQLHNFFGYSSDFDTSVGGYLPIFYLLLSIWNVVFIPMSLIGVYKYYKINKPFTIILIFQIINSILFYSFSYNGSIEPRHKLVYLVPQTVFALFGLEKILKNKVSRLMYYFILVIFLMAAPLIILN